MLRNVFTKVIKSIGYFTNFEERKKQQNTKTTSMKGFLKTVAAVLVGFTIIVGLPLVLFIIIAVCSSNKGTVKENTVLLLNLEGELQERSGNELYSDMGINTYVPGLDDILTSIEAAKTEEDIKGILIKSGAFSASTASLKEIRNALAEFKETGKFVYAYSGEYLQGAYYLSSVADSVFVNPLGAIDIHGLALSSTFYKRALEKIGIGIDVVKVGTCKSATEPYTNEQMSEPSKEQARLLIGDIWSEISQDIATSRDIDTSAIRKAADSMLGLRDAQTSIDLGLADRIAYYDEVKASIKQRLGMEIKEDLNLITPGDYVDGIFPVATSTNEIAVVYAAGEIDNGNRDGINSLKLSKQLEKLTYNDDVKAVVLRVNSPGGSAYGSEQIWHAVEVLKSKKPVVVSMGDYAASGGYYISCGAHAIVAEPTTITGSIGIFGILPNVAPLANKIGLDYDVVSTNRFSDSPNGLQKPDPAFLAILQKNVEHGYDTFLTRCADGRGMTKAGIDSIGQGRVWAGKRALELGLVDTLGTLNTAISIAAEYAGISKDYKIGVYPEKPSFWEQMNETPSLGIKLFATPKEFEREQKAIEQALQMDRLQAAMPGNIHIR